MESLWALSQASVAYTTTTAATDMASVSGQQEAWERWAVRMA
jgi:hypothetical protein